MTPIHLSHFLTHNTNRTLEDLSLRGLYRLISRSLHGFALLDLLRSAQDEKKLPVPWGTLKKISFRNLVTSQVVHDEVKKMLVELVGNACKVGEFILADQLTTRLTAGCFQVRNVCHLYDFEYLCATQSQALSISFLYFCLIPYLRTLFISHFNLTSSSTSHSHPLFPLTSYSHAHSLTLPSLPFSPILYFYAFSISLLVTDTRTKPLDPLRDLRNTLIALCRAHHLPLLNN